MRIDLASRAWKAVIVVLVSLVMGAVAHGEGVAVVVGNEPAILAPTQGRPVFVAPGETLRVTTSLPADSSGVRFELVTTKAPIWRQRLRPALEQPADTPGTHDLVVPDDLPEQTYDLVVAAGGATLVARHAVAVWRPRSRIRLVHLSNMNIGLLGVPECDERLIDEINLVGPTLVVLTGDLIDASHPDPQEGWREVVDFLARLDAPTLVACGDHDDVGLYSRYMAPSPVGTVEVGAYRGVVLYDVPAHPITGDADQIRWVEQLLGQRGQRLTFIVTHDEYPSLLDYWRAEGTLNARTGGGGLGVWLTGGQRDWDGREYRAIVEAAAPLMYVRTHQSSPALRGGASGVSHYRVLDLDGERVKLIGPMTPDAQVGSTAAGRLSVVYDGPNDGLAEQVTLTASSRLPFRIDGLTARVLVKRVGDQRPWCHGARLARLVEMGDIWDCRLAFDLPDKGMRRVIVGSGPEPAPVALDVRISGPAELNLVDMVSEDGVRYRSGSWDGEITIENRGTTRVSVTPLLRLDGEPIAYRVVDEEGPFADAYRLRPAPGEVLRLRLDLSAVRVAPGERELQVYPASTGALTPVCLPLRVTLGR